VRAELVEADAVEVVRSRPREFFVAHLDADLTERAQAPPI
jgi:hypothetical protein